MKKLLFLLALVLLPLAASARRPVNKSVSRTQLNTVLSEFRHFEGVEVVRLGNFAMSLIKGVASVAVSDEPEAREVRGLMRGIKRISVMSYDECENGVRERINRKLKRILDPCEVLMEIKDDDELVRVYGSADDRSGDLQDVILFVPESCALICVYGTISADRVGDLLELEYD
ncbi:MAG: DUF4252 domain-containing protein [Bacteroidales bacterium]|nr:DUF4252 domain-containing protein [Bacteroidales bacterium]